jgi:hypothetical protein
MYSEMADKYGKPWWALDECHIPANIGQGMLLHSDYKEKLRICGTVKLFEWHSYEQEPNLGKPDDYEYQAPTTLYSCFRFLAEEYLVRNKQMTFFASTYFSSWVPLLDKSKYSRAKLEIEEISDLPTLNLDIQQLARIIKHSVGKELTWEDWLQGVYERITIWNGRPGFLYCILLPKLMSTPPTTREEFLEIWEKARREAVRKVRGYIDNPIANSKVIKKHNATCLRLELYSRKNSR